MGLTFSLKTSSEELRFLLVMKGFVSGTFLGEPETGEYASLIVWESLENLKAAAQIGRPKFELATGGILKGPPSIRIYEVYQPK